MIFFLPFHYIYHFLPSSSPVELSLDSPVIAELFLSPAFCRDEEKTKAQV